MISLPRSAFPASPASPLGGSGGILLCHPGIRADHEARPPWVMIEQRMLNYSLTPASQTYLFALPSDHADRLLERLQREARNAVTGAPVIVRVIAGTFPKENLYKSDEGIHPWKSTFSPMTFRR